MILRYKQSPTLEVIDQSFLTRRRIVRHVQTALGIIVLPAAFLLLRNLPALILLAVATSVASALARPAVQRLIRYALPQPVQGRLPYGPLDVSERFGPPHSYRDLIRIWRDPSWQCPHQPDLRVPVTATNKAIGVPAISLFVVAAMAIIIAAIAVRSPWLPSSRKLPASEGIVAFAIGIQLAVTVSWNRRLRQTSVDLPTSSDVWITFFVAAAVSFVGLLVAIAGA